MKKVIIYTLWIVIFAFPGLCIPREIFPGEASKDSPINLDLNKFMPLEEIKPGMKGIGKTVFSGARIDEFQVEIIGILKNVTPHGDIILAKVTGGPLPLERTGVIAGMSGSPIYIQGKLIGALAYILSIFQTEPMAGITPIAEMLEDYEWNKTDMEWGTVIKAENTTISSPMRTTSTSLGDRNKLFHFWNSLNTGWIGDLYGQVSKSRGLDEESDWDVDAEIQKLKAQFSRAYDLSSRMAGSWSQTTNSGPFLFPYQAVGLPDMSKLADSLIQNISHFIPIKTPLAFSGLDERVLKEITPLLSNLDIIPVQGGGMAGSYDTSQDKNPPEADVLLPGSAVGIQLIRGDMNASGFGTITYINEKHVVAFGHPMFSAGKVDIPMTSAYVHMIMANQINSFKIASPISLKGSIRQDRRTGIVGVVGSYPQMIPLKIIVESEKDSRRSEYNFEVIDDDFFAPLFVRITCLNSMFTSLKAIGDATVKVRAEVFLKDRPTLIQENVFSGDGASVLASLASVRLVGILMNNPFEEVQVEKILITLSVAEKLEVAQIEGVRVSKDVFKPGDSIPLTIFLQPFQGELLTQKVHVPIPEWTPRGESRLMVCDSRIVNAFEKARAPFNFEPQNLTQLVSLLEKEEQNNEITVQLMHSRVGVTIKGREFSSPPSSLLAIMNSPRYVGEGGLTRGTVLLRQRISTNYMIFGCELLPIIVDNKYGMNYNESQTAQNPEQNALDPKVQTP